MAASAVSMNDCSSASWVVAVMVRCLLVLARSTTDIGQDFLAPRGFGLTVLSSTSLDSASTCLLSADSRIFLRSANVAPRTRFFSAFGSASCRVNGWQYG